MVDPEKTEISPSDWPSLEVHMVNTREKPNTGSVDPKPVRDVYDQLINDGQGDLRLKYEPYASPTDDGSADLY